MEEHRRPVSPRDRARSLRRAATEAERRLWLHLRRRLPLAGTYFRRQVALGPYFADFACLKYRLIVELDGEQHGFADNRFRDAVRTTFLERQGFLVLRFWNRQVFTEIDSVLDTIAASIVERETMS